MNLVRVAVSGRLAGAVARHTRLRPEGPDYSQLSEPFDPRSHLYSATLPLRLANRSRSMAVSIKLFLSYPSRALSAWALRAGDQRR